MALEACMMRAFGQAAGERIQAGLAPPGGGQVRGPGFEDSAVEAAGISGPGEKTWKIGDLSWVIHDEWISKMEFW